MFTYRTAHAWAQLKEAVVATEIECYPELATDLKGEINKHMNAAVHAAGLYAEQMRQQANLPSELTAEYTEKFQNAALIFNAEADLFCAKYAMAEKRKKQSVGNTVNIQKFTGVYGDVVNSQIILYDYSSIEQLLKDRDVPKQERRELEDIMDELKTAPPDKKPSLLKRGEDWIVKHGALLGTAAEAVGKAIGAAVK